MIKGGINTRSIQFRLILWYSGLIIVVLLAFAAYTYRGVRHELYGNMHRTLTRRAEQIATNILPNKSAALATEIHSVYSPEANNRFIRVTNSDGASLYVSGQPQDGRFDPAKIPKNPNPPPTRMEHLQGLDIFIVSTLTQDGHLIEMGIPRDDVEQTLHSLLITLLYGVPVIILIVAAGGLVLIRRSLQPVEDIRSTAERITFGNLSNRLPVLKTGDALEHLSVTLNQMLDRLEDAYEQVSRFSADASHELRTPLTIMRGELEAMVRQDIPTIWKERIGSVLEEAERLSRIAENLFTISRLDAGEARIEHSILDLAALAKNTAEQMALLAEEKSLTLHIDTPQSVQISGDPARLKQVIVNLLDNAIKYTPQGGNIWLNVNAEGQHASMEVRDDGVGIPAPALPHVFERFYRADKARSREQGGAGLGLSIVRSIVQAHGGNVEISSHGKGATCRVELALAG